MVYTLLAFTVNLFMPIEVNTHVPAAKRASLNHGLLTFSVNKFILHTRSSLNLDLLTFSVNNIQNKEIYTCELPQYIESHEDFFSSFIIDTSSEQETNYEYY